MNTKTAIQTVDSDQSSQRLFCCHMGCSHDAAFQITGNEAALDDMTHACEQHVGTLLGTPDSAPVDNKTWMVVLL